MAIFKCKICGGSLDIADGNSVAVCDYCGTKQTVSNTKDDVVANLFNRANNLRLKCEFDKAEQVYEKILDIDNTDAEAHWGMVLCKYGIEYVEDKMTDSKIPTCHRTLYEAILTDVDYLAAIENADVAQKELYEAEALVIDGLQKNILNIVNNEEPFDVFICYKETDETGKRTIDSSIANDIYYHLTQEGFKVFYAPITLENKLGYEYEPYIFAALNSAKVMLVVGTKPEHFDAVWVRNEWSRFLKLMKSERSKLLIPCYRDMDAYELPDEFAHLQAQDMSKIGFIQDLLRGINKLVSLDNTVAVKETVVVQSSTSGNVNIAPLLRRAFMFLEDGNIKSAREYSEKVLDISPECADAYLVKLMAEWQVKNKAELKDCEEPFDNSLNYQKILRFGDSSLVNELKGYLTYIKERKENERLEAIYREANDIMAASKTQEEYEEAEDLFKSINFYKNSEELANKCREEAEAAIKNAILSKAIKCIGDFEHDIIVDYEDAILLLNQIIGWNNADELIGKCEKKIEEIRLQEERNRIENERQNELKRIAKEKADRRNRKITIIATPIAAILFIFVVILNTIIIPYVKYTNAIKLMSEGNYDEAILAFEAMDGYKDSVNNILECKYSYAISLMKKGMYQEAIVAFNLVKDYKNSLTYIRNIIQNSNAKYVIETGKTHTVALNADGKVLAVGANSYGQCNVNKWKDIVAVSAGNFHTVGLKSNGAVITVGDNEYGQCNTNEWKDIVAISAGIYHTVGLKSDGTVVAVGDNEDGQCNTNEWKDIIAISAGGSYTVGLKSDGSVVAVGSNVANRCNVDEWEDIVAISAGSSHTVGLKSDGSVVAVGSNVANRCNVDEWEDIVAISAGGYHTVGLKSDGTVVAVGKNNNWQCEVDEWIDIVGLSSGTEYTVGLKIDGSVVAVGDNDYGQRDVEGWKLGIKYKITE